MMNFTKCLTLLLFCCINISVFAQPANDLCDNAVPIACGQTISGTTTNSTIDSPDCGFQITIGGVWYKFTGTGEVITASTCAYFTYDMVMSVYSGTCGNLECVSTNDDFCQAGGGSSVTFCSQSGVEYYILIYGFSSATGDFDLNITCAGTFLPGTITQQDSVCSGGIATLELTGFIPGTSIQWQESNVSGGTYTPIAGANQSTYSTPPVSATQYYTIEAVCGSSTYTTPEFILDYVTNSFAGSIYNGFNTICEGTSIQLDYTNTYYDYPGTIIQWQESSNSGGPYSNIPGATGASIQTGGLTQDMYYVVESTCSGNSQLSYEVPLYVASSIEAENALANGPTSVCPGSGTELFHFSNSIPIGITYQWSQSLISGGPYTDFGGTTTSSTITTPALTQPTYFVVSASCGSLNTTSNEVEITMGPVPGSVSPAQYFVCPGNTTQIISDTYSNSSTGVTFQWKQSSISGGPYVNIPGETNPSLTTGPITSLTYFVLETSCGGYSSQTSETSVDAGIYGGYIAAEGNAVCQGSSTLIHSSYTEPGVDFQWQQSNVSGGPYTDIAGENGPDLNTGALNQTTYFVLKSSCGGLETISNEEMVDVNQFLDPGSAINYSPSTVCSGNNAILTYNAGNTNAIFQWAQSTVSGGPYTDIPGETNSFLTTAPLFQNTYFIVRSSCGSLTSTTSEISVNVGVYVADPYASTTNLCPGGQAQLYGNYVTDGASLQWQQSQVSGGPYTDIPGETNFNLTTPPFTQNTYYVLRGSCGNSSMVSGEIAITLPSTIPTPIIANYSGSQICSGTSVQLINNTSYPYPDGTQFQWRQSADTAGPYTDIPGETNYLYSSSPLSATTYFTMRASCANLVSESEPVGVTIASASDMNPGFAYNYSGTEKICPGQYVTLYQYGETYGSTLQWQQSSVSGGPYSDIPGADQSGIYYSQPLVQNTYFVVKASCGNISALTSEITVKVGPDPGQISPTANINVCRGSSVTLFTSGYTVGSLLQWQSSSNKNGPYTDIPGAISDSYISQPLSQTQYYKVKSECGTTYATSAYKKVKIGTSAGLINGQSYVCSGAPLYLYQISDGSNTLAGDFFQWKKSTHRNGPFTAIQGANSSTLSTSITQTTYFVLTVTCGNGTSNTTPVYPVSIISNSNDNMCQAKNINVGATINFINSCATSQPGEPVPPLAGPGGQDGWKAEDFSGTLPVVDNSMWFTFRAPGSRAVSISCSFTNQSGYNPQIAIYSSSNDKCTGIFTLLAANDNSDYISSSSPSVITSVYCLQPNKKYFIQVDGNHATSGAGTLRVTSISNTVTVCHPLPNNQFQTLHVSACNLPYYLSRGDQLGACPGARASMSEELTSLPINNESFIAYPNPTDNILNYSFISETATSYQLLLMDISGRILLNNSQNAVEGVNSGYISMMNYKAGIYFLVISSGTKNKQIKIVRE